MDEQTMSLHRCDMFRFQNIDAQVWQCNQIDNTNNNKNIYYI